LCEHTWCSPPATRLRWFVAKAGRHDGGHTTGEGVDGEPSPWLRRLGRRGREAPAPVGGPAIIKARTETTNGTITALEVVIPPTQGPPLHRHRRKDELWYLLAGRLRVKLDEQLLDAPTGSLVFIPRGTPHCFQNIGDDPARLLAIFTPAGMERFFEGAADLPPGAFDAAAFRAVAQRAGMEIVGKPLAAGL
jgi:quercetin dioxygenase-like cupin family protein